MDIILIEPFVLTAAAAMTAVVSYCASLFAAQTQLFLDHPNDRSSHVHATPRTGGLAIVGGWLVGLFVIGTFAAGGLELARSTALIALLAAAALGIGLADDRFELAPAWKLVGQFVIAAIFVVLFGPLQTIPAPYVGDLTLSPPLGVFLTIVWIAGFMNAFNFMDGANGLAAGAATVGLAWIAVIAAGTGATLLFVASFLLALAALGFLPQNLKRGKLFMGDNGSQALGFLIAAFGVLGANWTGGRMSALIVPVIFMPLIFDVAWTLVSRAIRKKNILKAHREHLYQLMIRSGAYHSAVAVIYMGLVAISAAVALLMLTLPYSLQWLAPLTLSAFFSAGAAVVYRRAVKDGLLGAESDIRHPEADPPLQSDEDGSLSAAE